MRPVKILLLAIFLQATSAYAADTLDFDTFMRSREVVATLYFEQNAETLSTAERERITGIAEQLRALQKADRMIRVEGFSSPDGDRERNFHLSFFRARNVADLIEAEGLPAQVTLTGYGDLLANSKDGAAERRVEVVSYVKPALYKKLRIAEEKSPAPRTAAVEAPVAPAREQEIDSLTVDRAIKDKLEGGQKQLADEKPVPPPIWAPRLTQAQGTESPIIDALTIEQAIMEKIGADSPQPSGAVTRVDHDF